MGKKAPTKKQLEALAKGRAIRAAKLAAKQGKRVKKSKKSSKK